MPFLHADYSELKAVKVQWIRKTFISPSTVSNNLDRGPGSEELSHRDNFIKKKKKKTYYEKTLVSPPPLFSHLFGCAKS